MPTCYSRTAGSIFSYSEKFDEETWESTCYAVEHYNQHEDENGKLSEYTDYYEELYPLYCQDACWGMLSESDFANLQAQMTIAAKKIAAKNAAQGWYRKGAAIGSSGNFGGGESHVDLNARVVTVYDWAFTANPHWHNVSSPSQHYNKLRFYFSPGVEAVKFRVFKKNSAGIIESGFVDITIKNEQFIGMDELSLFFPWRDLPEPIVTTCAPSDPEMGSAWPRLDHVVNDLYPWGGKGDSVDLEFRILKVICSGETEQSVAASTDNAYYNALPEELK